MTRLRASGFAGQACAGNDNHAWPQIFLHIDGPLAFRGKPERELVADMAAHLRKVNVLGTEADAIRALCAGPYRLGDVATLAGDALFDAQQQAAADTMARS